MNNTQKNTLKVAIIMSGAMGAGKTTAANYICKKYNFVHLSYVDLIWLPILKERNIDICGKSLQDLGDELMKKYGIGGLAKKIIPFISESPLVIIDDVRHPNAFKELKKSLNAKVYLFFIKSPNECRADRLKIRDNISTKEEFEISEQRRTEISIKDVEKYADFIIVNDNNLEHFFIEIDQCISKIELF